MSETSAERKARILAERPDPEQVKRMRERVNSPGRGDLATAPSAPQMKANADALRRRTLEDVAGALPGAVMPHDALRRQKKKISDLDNL